MKSACILLASLLLVACQREQTAATHTAAATPQTAQAAVAPVSSELVSVAPESLADCNPAAVTVHWDVQSKPGVNEVEIWVGSGPAAKLFAAGGSHGEAQTGAWARPGEVFAVRLPGGTQELGKAVVGGPVCP